MNKNVEIINKMLISLEVKTGVALANKLNVGQAAVSAWKTRGVPLKAILQVSEMTGRPVEWFKGDQTEEMEKPAKEDPMGLAVKEARRVLDLIGPSSMGYKISGRLLEILEEGEKEFLKSKEQQQSTPPDDQGLK